MKTLNANVCEKRCCCAGMCEGLIKLNKNGMTETECKERMYNYI